MEAVKRSNRYSVSSGPGLASGWNWTVKQFFRLYFSPSTVPSLTFTWDTWATAGSTLSPSTT